MPRLKQLSSYSFLIYIFLLLFFFFLIFLSFFSAYFIAILCLNSHTLSCAWNEM